MGEDDNFWPASAPSQGPDGVCGPCSEIYFHPDGGKSVEIWNLVFTQFNRVGEPPNNLRPLPSKNIDTGMGLERMAAVLQGVDTNYHIDILRPIVEAAGEVCGVKYDPADDNGRRLRRIADHVRACTFAIHENVLSRAEQGEVRHQAAAPPGRARRPPDGLARAVPAQARAGRGRDDEAAVSGTAETRSSACSKVIKARRTTSSARSTRARIASSECSTRCGRQAASIVARARRGRAVSRPTACRPSCSRRWRPSITWRSTGTAIAQAMEEHGEKSGKIADVVFKTRADRRAEEGPARRPSSWATRPPRRPAEIRGIVAAGSSVDELDEVGHENPVQVVLDRIAVLWRMRRPGRRHGRASSATGFEFRVTDTQKDGGLIVHHGHLRRRHDESRREGDGHGRSRAAAGHSPRPLGHAHSALRPAEEPRQARPAAWARRSTTIGCGSISPILARSTPSKLAAIEHDVAERSRRRRADPVETRAAGRSPRRPAR